MAFTCRFTPIDTWFFKESRPMESIGDAELSSVFPPPARTLIGAIRAAIGAHNGIDWHDKKHKLIDQIGDNLSFGQIRLEGPWVNYPGDNKRPPQRLFAAPYNLLRHTPEGSVSRLTIGTPVHCDLGKVRLPRAPSGAKPVRERWITQEGLQTVLNGNTPRSEDLIDCTHLYHQESRLGIARDNYKRTVERNLLYQTRHLRLKPSVSIDLDINGIDQSLLPDSENRLLRLGGEGRMAAYECPNTTNARLSSPTPPNDAKGVILVLLSNANAPVDGNTPTPLPGFTCTKENHCTVWRGSINGVELTLHTAACAHSVREGGWDLVENAPRPAESLIPAGSVFYCTVDNGDIPYAIKKLHNAQLLDSDASTPTDATNLTLGRGLLAAGIWPANEFTEGD